MYSFYDYMQMGGMPQMKSGGEPNGSMALGQMAAVQDKMNKLLQFVKPDDNLDPWIASKLAVMDHSADAIADYMMYGPDAQGQEEEMEQMMRGGGYVVARSSDRKGKTHKVTGPDGTVKYFGDSKLGQHPKDPERKKAFYARHKKNLAGNPYFRAFARKTWEDGGEIDMMAEGGSTFSGNAWYENGGYIPDLGMVIEGLSKYQTKGQVDENDAWIRKIMEFEETKGSGSGTGLPNWGFNSRDPKSLNEAVDFYKQDFLPKVQQYPMGIRERMGDYMYNTGRNPNDLLLYNAGKISLDQLNSPSVFTNEWNQYGADIEKMYSDPTFINKLDQSRDDVYRTTKQVNGQPNPAYDASWKDRARMFGPSMSSVAPIGTQKLAGASPVVNQAPKVSAAKPVMQVPSLTDAPLLQLNTNRQPNYNWTNFSQATASQEPQQMATQGNTPPQVNYNGKQQAYLSDMYGSGMMTFDNKQQMDLKGQGVNTYAWDSFGQDQSAPGKTAAMKEADKPFQIEQQQAINPIYGDVEKLQSMLNVASRKDLKAYVKDFNDTYGSNMKVPGSYMGADGQKTLRKIDNFSNFLRKGISTGSGVMDLFNMRKGKREQEWRDRNLGSTSSLYPVVPENMSGNRGDYVATGSRYGDFRPDEKTVNLGQYTGKFYPQLNMQFGGGILDEELTMPSELIESPVMVAANTETPSAPPPAKKSSGSSGANPLANETWNDISTQFQGVTNMGIWGDERHKKRVSDHNTGDALDIGIKAIDQGKQIAQKLIDESKNRNVKYIIFNRQIWNPSVNKWLPYDGENPHTDHVHVSFNRNNDKPKNSEDLGQISLTHNNPLNIHQGSFAAGYGGVQGSRDGSGYVSKFNDMNVGIQAAKDLLFGPNYNNLTISQARNKWVKGNPNTPSESSSHIVQAIGADKKLSQLNPFEKDQLIKQFAKWEGKQAYNKIKDMKLFEDGGSISYNEGDIYELSEDQIRSILSAGGNVEFM